MISPIFPRNKIYRYISVQFNKCYMHCSSHPPVHSTVLSMKHFLRFFVCISNHTYALTRECPMQEKLFIS